MSRKIRVWHPGSIFHITSRGNRHATLFYDDFDRKKYLTLLNETCEKFPFYHSKARRLHPQAKLGWR